jgi:hypothetical protein
VRNIKFKRAALKGSPFISAGYRQLSGFGALYSPFFETIALGDHWSYLWTALAIHLFFSVSKSSQAASSSVSYTILVDPRGSFLPAAPGDSSDPATRFDLTALMNDPSIELKPGDIHRHGIRAKRLLLCGQHGIWAWRNLEGDCHCHGSLYFKYFAKPAREM